MRALSTDSDPCRSSAGGSDHRKRDRRSMSSDCCSASHTHAICSDEKAMVAEHLPTLAPLTPFKSDRDAAESPPLLPPLAR